VPYCCLMFCSTSLALGHSMPILRAGHLAQEVGIVYQQTITPSDTGKIKKSRMQAIFVTKVESQLPTEMQALESGHSRQVLGASSRPEGHM